MKAVAPLAAVSGKVGGRIEPRLLGSLGAGLVAVGGLYWISSLEAGPDYLGAFLPGMLIGGVGVGLTLPAVTAGAVASLPPDQLATGIAVNTMMRQIGAALGIAIWIAVVGTPAPSEALHAFADGWWVMVTAATGAAVALAGLGRLPAPVAAPPLAPPSPALPITGRAGAVGEVGASTGGR